MMKLLRQLNSAAFLALMLPCCATMATEKPFRHPGALDSASEFEAITQALHDHRSPWNDELRRLRANHHDSPHYQPHPVTIVIRGGAGENYNRLFNDAAAAYALALDWRLTGDTERARQAAFILSSWSHSTNS